MGRPRNEPERRVTLADVARRSGMSPTAVSLILNDRPGSRLSKDAVARVRAAAAELGYRPNSMARSLRLGRTGSIGFLSDEVTITRPASGILRGVLTTARTHGKTVLISETSGDASAVEEAMATLLDHRVDALVIGLMVAREIELPAPPPSVPVVVVNGRTPEGVPNVLPDEARAGSQVAAELLGAGHRHIGIVSDLPEIAQDPRRSISIGVRFDACVRMLREAGVEPAWTAADGWSPEIGYSMTREIMEAHPELTALVAGNDQMAFGIYQALAELGLRVGTDVSVISFDDEHLAASLRPGLTTARLDYEEMARRGTEMVLGLRDVAHELVPMPLIRRGSVGAPRG